MVYRYPEKPFYQMNFVVVFWLFWAHSENREYDYNNVPWTDGLKGLKGRYTLGDKLQQQVAATDHSVCTGPATSCSNMLRRHIEATNRFVCTGDILWKSLSLQQNFVTATSRTNSVWFDFLQNVPATKFFCRNKDFHKNSQIHTKRFVAAMCCSDMLLQLVS